MRNNKSNGRRFHGSSGETLAETLISVLIISLASVTLAAMIGSASNMNIRAREYDKALDDALTAISAATAPASDGTMIWTVEGAGDTTTPPEYVVSIRTAEVGGNKLSAYEKKSVEG